MSSRVRILSGVVIAGSALVLSACASGQVSPTADSSSVEPSQSATQEAEGVVRLDFSSELPKAVEYRNSDGWTYAVTLTSVPSLTFSKETVNSPPGKAEIVARFGAEPFTADWTGLDEGKNAPAPSTPQFGYIFPRKGVLETSSALPVSLCTFPSHDRTSRDGAKRYMYCGEAVKSGGDASSMPAPNALAGKEFRIQHSEKKTDRILKELARAPKLEFVAGGYASNLSLRSPLTVPKGICTLWIDDDGWEAFSRTSDGGQAECLDIY